MRNFRLFTSSSDPEHSHLFWWLCFFVVLIPFSHVRIEAPLSSIGLTSIFLMGFILSVSFSTLTREQTTSFVGHIRTSFTKHFIFFVFLAIFLCTLLINVLTTNTLHGWGVFIEWFVLPCISLLLFSWRSTYDRISLTLGELSLLTLIGLLSLFCATLPFYFMDVFTYDHRLSASWSSPNTLAMRLAPLLLLCSILMWQITSTRYRILLALGGIIGFYILFLTQSLGAIGSVAITLSLLIVFSFVKNRDSLSGIQSYLLITLLLSSVLLLFFVVTSKIQSSYQVSGRSPLDSRVMIWRTSIDMIRESPLVGQPLGAFQDTYLDHQEYYPPYLEWAVPHPHNTYLFLWLSGGWLALTSFLILIVYISFLLHKKRSTSVLLSQSLLIFFLLYSFVETITF